LSPQTISNIIAELMKKNLVHATGQRPRAGGGKPSTLLEINPSGGFSVGINIYLDALSAVLIDLGGNIHQSVHINNDRSDPQSVIPMTIQIVKDILNEQGLRKDALLGIGIGLPGPLNTAEGIAAKPPDYSAWHRHSTFEAIRSTLGVPVLLENNANAAAIGERWFGCGRDISNFIYVSFGMYLGGAIMLNGQLHRGIGGFAGEFGDMPVLLPEGETTGLAECASPAVLYDMVAATHGPISGSTKLEDLYHREDPIVKMWLDATARKLAPTMATAEYLFDPEAIILGGRLPPIFLNALVAKLTELMAEYRRATKRYAPQLICSNTGELAGALGAATLTFNDLLAPHPTVLSKQSTNHGVA
jgi:predicted NBD/HSP70 family sugar kinase